MHCCFLVKAGLKSQIEAAKQITEVEQAQIVILPECINIQNNGNLDIWDIYCSADIICR